MGSKDKYTMFKNFLHNELNISKEDIREWIFEAIKFEVSKVVNNTFKNIDIDEQIKATIRSAVFKPTYWDSSKNELKDDIKKEIASYIGNKFMEGYNIGKRA